MTVHRITKARKSVVIWQATKWAPKYDWPARFAVLMALKDCDPRHADPALGKHYIADSVFAELVAAVEAKLSAK
jgi:hypothetical protein